MLKVNSLEALKEYGFKPYVDCAGNISSGVLDYKCGNDGDVEFLLSTTNYYNNKFLPYYILEIQALPNDTMSFNPIGSIDASVPIPSVIARLLKDGIVEVVA